MYSNNQVSKGLQSPFHLVRIAAGKVRSALLTLILVIAFISPALGNPPVFVSNSSIDSPGGDGNGTAIIGEAISYQVTFLSVLPAPHFVQVQHYVSGPVSNMNLTFSVPALGIYQYSFQTPPFLEGTINGNFPNSPSSFFITNASGTVPCAPVSQVTLDNRPPVRSGPLGMTVNAIPYTGQILRRGDVLGFSQSMNPTAFQAGESALLDLSAWGFGTVPLTSANPHAGNYTITTGIDLVGNIGFQATDPNGNATSAVALTGVSIDSIPSVITSANVTLVPVGLARPGAQATIQVVLAGPADGETVIASCTFLGGTALPLALTGPNTYSGTFTVASSPPMTSIVGTTYVDVRVTDNGLNVATASTAPFSIDNRLPLLTPLPRAILTQINPPTGDGIGIVGDLLTIQATATWDPVQIPTANVYADLSSLGGPVSIALTAMGPTTYVLSYTIPAGISEESPAKSFRVWAIDSATGNTIQDWTTPVLQIDNLPPVIVSATLTRVSGTGTSYKTNDQFRIRAQVNNLPISEMGQVSAQIASLSPLYTNTQPLNPDPGSPGFFEGIFTVGAFSPGIGWDLPAFDIRLIASDHAGNIGTGTVNTGIPIDNEPVVIATTTGSYTHNLNPIFDDGHARVGDTVRFHVTLTAASTFPFPPTDYTATIDLSGIGLSPTQAMTASAGNLGGFDFTIPSLATGTVNRANVVFPVRVVDNNGNQDISSVTMPIDNLPPVIVSATLTRVSGTGTSYKTNDQFRIRAQVSNLLPSDQVSARIASLSVLYTNSQPLIPDPFNPGFVEATFTVGSFSPGLGWDLPAFDIQLIASDQAGNITFRNVNTGIPLDNEPVMIGVMNSSYTHNLNPSDDDGHARIGDTIRFHVSLTASSTFTIPPTDYSAFIDLSGIGSTAVQAMTASAANLGGFDFTIPALATGTINRASIPFPIRVVDNNGNQDVSSITILIDNNPPDPASLTLFITYKPGATDINPNFVNLNKHVLFRVPYVPDVPADPATGTLITDVVSLFPTQFMAWDLASYSTEFDTATQTVPNSSATYRFRATIQDLAGNLVLTQSGYYNVDCFPPSISSISATIVGGGSIATISSQIRIRTLVSDNDGNRPTVNLANIGGSNSQLMTSVGGGWYEYTALVNAGSIQTSASWTVTIKDASENGVSSDTNVLFIDNQAPTPGPLLVTWTDIPLDGRIRLGDTASFTMTTADPDPGTATINLTAIGSGSAVQMNWFVGTSSFALMVPAAFANAEYLNYVFTATVTDANGNISTVNAIPVTEVDCQPASFSALGIAITQTNGDNPVATVSNSLDIITVFASISHALDAAATATIFVPGTFTQDLPMTYVAIRNRHEASFTVPLGGGAWGYLSFDALSYSASATDNVGNLSQTAVQSSAPGFTVKNLLPTIGLFNFTLNPDFLNVSPYLNVGSSTIGDRLLATASLAGGELVTSGNLNLSAVPGAPASFPLSVAGTSAGNPTGISFTGYPLTDLINATFTITLRDQAGNPATASQMFLVDTRRPSIASATFDGTLLTVNSSEEIGSVAISEWRLVGSLTNGLPAYMPLSSGTLTPLLYSFEVAFGITERQTLAGWASTPLHLEIISIATAPLTDLSGNWLPGNNRSPVVITDSTWRTPARIINFFVDTTNWPASISMDLVFDRVMASSTLVASQAVLLTSALGYEFASIDYATGYVFQASDTVSWPAPDQLHIELCSDARDWVTRKLGSGTTVLRFANRTSISVFIRDELARGSQLYPTSAPLSSSAVARPATALFKVNDPPGNLTLNVASGTLEVALSGKALLYSNNFVNIDGTLPVMGKPVPTYASRTTLFHSKLILHDTAVATSARLTLQPLELISNGEVSSSTIHLKLTDSDTATVLAMFLNNPAPIWGMRVDAGAFANWWDQASLMYLPSGFPGNITVVAPSTAGSAALAAASISDPPPTKNASAGALAFEFDFAPAYIGSIAIPIAANVPVARIIGSSSQHLATGTFQSWTTRTVAGKTRYSARFVNETPLPDGLQAWESLLEISGVTDVFGNTIALSATSTVYDLALRSVTDPRGFSSGTAALIIDTATPTVLSIVPATIARANAGALTVTVTFNEAMDTSVAPPVLTIATTTPVQSIPFNVGVWGPGGTTVTYTNTAIIPAGLSPQGFWSYTLTAVGRDLAGNNFLGNSTFPAEIRTDAPPVTSTILTLTRQFLTATPTVDLPGNVSFSPTGALLGTAIASLTYSSVPVNLPHTLRLVRPFDGASFTTGIAFSGLIGAATVNDALFGNGLPGPYGPASYLAQVFDSAGNSIDVATFVYDSIPPDLSFLGISGAASVSNTIWYATSSISLTGRVNTLTTTDNLWLTAWSATAWTGQAGIATGATATYPLTQTLPGTYSGAINTSFDEGDFTLGVADRAGNVTMPPLPIYVRIDRTRPTVTSIIPNTTIGNSSVGAVTCTVTFSEPMEGNPTFNPTLTLATSTLPFPGYSSGTILFAFSSWTASDTAQFVNVSPISTIYRPGSYTYNLVGGRDLAGNVSSFTIGAYTLNVQSQGPAATPVVWSQQPLISVVPTDLLSGFPVASPGSAIIELSYSGAPSNTPHVLLVYDWNGVNVATYSDIGGFAYPIVGGFASVSVDAQGDGWGVPVVPSGPLSYSLRLRDNLLNVSGVLGSFTYDSLAATVDTLTLTDSKNGIASGGIRYYSPVSGNNLSIVAGSNATDTQRLILFDGAATNTALLTRVGTTHSIATGSTLAEGFYALSFADMAGNFADGLASTALVVVDASSPVVVSATPISLGSLAAQTGVFNITFSEPMYTASVPAVLIATSGTTLTLIASPAAPACWVSSTTCRFTNQTAIPSTLVPQGFYDYVVSGGRDYAGNPTIGPASGTIQVSIYSQAPVATLRVWTQQPLLDPTPAWIADRPFSSPANNGIASLAITYSSGPFNTPQQLLMYNAANENVATFAVPTVAPYEVAFTVAVASWPTAPGAASETGPTPYTFKLLDGFGNLSSSMNLLPSGPLSYMVYDSKPASITGFVFSDIGIASGGIKYYSPVLGNTTVTLTTNATDPQRLVIISPTATLTVPLTQTPAGSGIFSVATGSGLAQGLYAFTAADLAGNFATGPEYVKLVQVDASQPVVLSVNPSIAVGGSPIYSTPARAALFDVTFSEPMSSGTVPVVWLVNGSFQTSLIASPTAPACWISSTTCRFVNNEAFVATFPQGVYNYSIAGGRDYAGNTTVSSVGSFTLEIQSRGPTVSSYLIQSQQATTASGTPWPVLINQPFSHLVAPNAASLTVTLTTASGTPGTRLHFYQAGVSVASMALAWDGTFTIGTFTWDVATGPIPVNVSPYTLRIVDANGNQSIETSVWTMDATAPAVLATPTVSDLSTTTQLIHYSPAVTPNVSFSFSSSDVSGLRLRMTTLQAGVSATDTWPMTKGAGTIWTSSFAGRFSNTTVATDGEYLFDVVDPAGNIGVAEVGIGTFAVVVLDTVVPVVSSYTLRVAGLGGHVSRFAAQNASLAIELTLDPSTPFVATGVYEVDVLNDLGQTINRLPLVASGATPVAWWNGTNLSGATVLDGTYSFRARDRAGNRAANTVSVFAVTSPFRLLGGSEVTSSSIQLFFNHPVDATSLPGAICTFSPVGPAVSSFTFVTQQTLIASLAPSLADAVTYQFEIATLSLRDADGAPLAHGQAGFTFIADAAGPVLATPAVSFTGITNARQFYVRFSEIVTLPTAAATAAYQVTGPAGIVPVSLVGLQADRSSVLVTVASDLISGVNYQLVVNGVEDQYRNVSIGASANTAFTGRDQAAPVFSIAVFSNPANEYDIMVAGTVNEALSANPVVKVTQSGAQPVEFSMLSGTLPNSYMQGVHLNPNFPGNGVVEVRGTDIAGNVGTSYIEFALALINASIRAEVDSPDRQFKGIFPLGCFGKNTAVKWLSRGSVATGTAVSSTLAKIVFPKNITKNLSNHNLTAQAKELESWGNVSELAIPEGRLLKPFGLSVRKLPNDHTKKWGLYLQESSGNWMWQASLSPSNPVASISHPGVFGVFSDGLAPRVSLKTVFSEAPITDPRPLIEGTVEENGSGIEQSSIEVILDGESRQISELTSSGTFKFQPLASLSSGKHELIIRATDRSGNVGESARIQFNVLASLKISEMITFPNPARDRVTLRVSANRSDLDLDELSIKIYDISGDRVQTLSGSLPRLENPGDVYRYDVVWDLRNEDGKKVANGVYLARMEIRDPEDARKKIKKTHKIVVLR